MHMEDFGFIILRHITDQNTSLYWRECVSCIRKFYDHKIIIIDDNSKVKGDFAKECSEYHNIEIHDCDIVCSGEIYAYYYAYKHRPFSKFIVLHDSMFLQGKLPDIDTKTVKFLWHFDTYLGGNRDAKIDTNPYFINFCKIDEQEKIYDLYYDKSKWYGCFAVTSIITLSFLDKIFETYEFENAIKNVNCRHHREAMERVFALLCLLLDDKLFDDPSLFGNILTDYDNAYTVNWSHYVNGYRNKCLINKVWTGR